MKKLMCMTLSFLLLIGFAFSLQAEAATTDMKSRYADDEEDVMAKPVSTSVAAPAAATPAAPANTDLAKATQVLKALSTGSEDEVRSRMESLKRLSQVLQTKQQMTTGEPVQEKKK